MSDFWLRVKCFVCKLMTIDPHAPSAREKRQHANDFLVMAMNDLAKALKERDERR